MKAFVHGMAALSGVRDRDALNGVFARLVMQTVQDRVRQLSLIRVVGEGADRRCLVCARLTAGSDQLDSDPVWRDWSELPLLADSVVLARVVALGESQSDEGPPHRSVFPIKAETGVWGILELTSDAALDEIAQVKLLALLETYQNVMGLLDYGEKDALTELLNRKTFDGAFFKAASTALPPQLDAEYERRSAFAGGGYWLAVLDIDHFKRVNDSYGHLIGDEVLLLVARIMRNSLRFHDQLYRFGGEEFVILMRCRDGEEAAHALERLRSNVQAYAFPQVGSITVSIGFSALQPHDTPSAAFGRADQAVYHAKSHGRNQVVSYQTILSTGTIEAQAQDMDVELF